MRYGDYKRGEEATYEWKLPVFFPIIQIDTISDIEGALNTLEHNSNRLTSKYDIR